MTTARNHRPRTSCPGPHPGASRRPGTRTATPATGGRPNDSRPSTSRAGARRPRASRVLADRRRRARRRAAFLWSAAVLAVAGAVTAALLTTGSGSVQNSTVRPASGFTLRNTSGKLLSLASYRGRDVVLYFSEGVGCGACFYQMRQFEQHSAELARAGITILPIVMNPASQVRHEMASYGLHTPYLIDATGKVSRAHGVLGKGMHAGLPGHGFVLIDAHGRQRWYGEYPSMYLSTAGLIKQVRAHLAGRAQLRAARR